VIVAAATSPVPRVASTIDVRAAAATSWDVIVVGAGPAGAAAAITAGRAGRSVLLIDRATFPRAKVCGGCLNPAALLVLDGLGVGDVVRAIAVLLREVEIAAGRARVRLPMPGGVAVARDHLDPILIGRAIEVGAAFLASTRAVTTKVTDERRRLHVIHDDQDVTLIARVVIAADGLGGRLVPRRDDARDRDRHVGIGAIVPDAAGPPPGRLVMACSAEGYAGVVRLADGAVDVAAALRPAAIRAAGGAAAAMRAVFASTGVPWPGDGVLRGVPGVERRAACAALPRLLVAGDASAAAQPFTGQGIAWALATGQAAGAHAAAASEERAWHPRWSRAWEACNRRLSRERRRAARLPVWAAEHPRVIRAIAPVLRRWPALARPTMTAIGRPPSIVTGAGDP